MPFTGFIDLFDLQWGRVLAELAVGSQFDSRRGVRQYFGLDFFPWSSTSLYLTILKARYARNASEPPHYLATIAGHKVEIRSVLIRKQGAPSREIGVKFQLYDRYSG